MGVNTCDAVVAEWIGNWRFLHDGQSTHVETPLNFIFLVSAEIVDVVPGIRLARAVDLHVESGGGEVLFDCGKEL